MGDTSRDSAGEFVEVADRVWVARHDHLDVNVTAVAGDRGVLLVDTLDTEGAARAMLSRLGVVTSAPLVAVVNTHDHYDHWYGNEAVLEGSPDADVLVHEDAEVRFPPTLRRFSSVGSVDLGDRFVEVVHLGRGHTAGDVVVRVADADVLLAGDLVEESAPPSYGDDSFPLEWPATLDLLTQMLTADSVVVPGHGAPVGRSFVQDQRGDVGMVAERIYDAATRRLSLDAALQDGDWPFPAEHLRAAVRRGLEQVPLSARRLPVL